MSLTGEDALRLRLRSLLLDDPAIAATTVAEVVEWFGAMQAQDLASGLWSFGVRLPGLDQDGINKALEDREAIRTWPMRGTVHWVPPRDAHWMLEVTGVKALAGAAKRREHLGLSDEHANGAVDAIGAALSGGARLTRAECLAAVEEAGFSAAGQLGYHLLWYASQQGVSAIAPNAGGEQTFVLLDDWVPKPNRPDHDEALAILATRYFRSHGPTTAKDFAGWTGLSMGESRKGIAAAGKAVVKVQVDDVEMYSAPDVLDGADTDSALGLWMLPGFDEFMLGYKDRALMLRPQDLQAVIPGGNGIFRSTIVRDGRVIATWKRKSTTAKRLLLEVFPLVKIGVRERARVQKAFGPYSHYLGQPVELAWPD